MIMDSFKERVLPFIKDHFIALLIGVSGLVFLAYGFVSLYYVPHVEEEIAFASKDVRPSTSLRQESKKESAKKTIMVDVAGAVVQPGVYPLPSDSRVQDAILKAGGMTPSADRQRIAQSLNLAAPLTDGAKIYIPVFGEQMAAPGATTGNDSTGSSSTLGTSTSLINLNNASQSELESLPGVGEVTAGKIIENRPYGSVEELLEKKVVGDATFEKIRELVSVY